MSKFKAGDKVRFIHKDSDKHFIKGNIYNVIKNSDQAFWIEKDETNQKNGWNEEYFELVEEKKKYYKWNVQVTFVTGMDISILDISETEHHVSEDKIEDYIAFLVKKHKSDGIVEKRFNKIEDKFVEE